MGWILQGGHKVVTEASQKHLLHFKCHQGAKQIWEKGILRMAPRGIYLQCYSLCALKEMVFYLQQGLFI